MKFIHVNKPGMLTTVQDRGRWGLQAQGVAVAGPMDPCSHRLANALVGNAAADATLEVTLVGPELEFEAERCIAITGAEFEATVDGRPIPMNAATLVPAGGQLRFGRRGAGTRAYLAVEGGIRVAPILGSRATHLTSGMGGFDGRALRSGDRLPISESTRSGKAFMSRPRASIVPLPGREARLRILPGPQDEYFSKDSLDALQSAPYRISHTSDRMGYRLEGPRLTHSRGADIISDATPLGVLQVPASCQPILLMADRQTTGGYPKIATVISADISIAGQLGPGDTIQFAVCSLRDALAALIAQERALMAVEVGEA